LGFRRIRTKVRQNNKDHYLSLIALHVLLAFLIYIVPLFSKFYFIGVVAYFLVKIVSAKLSAKPKTVIFACCYVVGSEVLFRMTGGTFLYEAANSSALSGSINIPLGKSYPFLVYLALLTPSIFIAYLNIGLDSNFRTNIAFVLSGPVCLGLSAIYLYDKKIKMYDMMDALKYLSLPIISMTTYLFSKFPP